MTGRTLAALAGKDAEGAVILRAPAVGLWSVERRHGELVEPGSPIGTLTQLARRFALVVPDGVSGRVAIAGGAQDALPVAYGETLFGLTPSGAASSAPGGRKHRSAAAVSGVLSIAAPTDGVFYRSPALDAAPYVSVGDRIRTGRPVGLIEVMKTFNPIVYGGVGFPDEAEVVEILVGDAQEVRAGQALVSVKKR